MTLIQKITLHGFKSFAKRTEIPFGDEFNIIIGANGSGKSNITDAICFVLGKSNSRELRADKAANLIYNGGKNNQPAKNAEVVIEFNNENNEFSSKEKLIQVSRTVKASGVSTYRLNNEVVTRQQVLDLLNTAKIDPDGHNIILQGDIVLFTEMKPLERRQIIENIAGISMYEDKKAKTMLELEKVDSKLNESEIILAEREANLRELKKDRDQALKYKDMQSGIVDHKATYINLQQKEKQTRIEELDKKIQENQSQIEQIDKSIKELKNNINSWKDKIKNITTELEDKGEKEQITLRKEIGELKEGHIKANVRIDTLKSELKKLELRKEQLKNNIKEVENKIKDLNSYKSKLASEVKAYNDDLSKITKSIKDFKEKHGISNMSDLDDIEKSIDLMNNEIIQLNENRQNTIREKDRIQFHIDGIEEKLNELKNDKELIDLKEKRNNLKNAADKLNKFLNEDSSYASQLSKLRNDLIKQNEDYYRLKTKLSLTYEKIANDLAVKKILELKKKGVYGTILELGKVDSKYSLALKVAAGPRISSIVVEDDAVASSCIKYLKENKFGIATFLPLNKIKGRKFESKEILKKEGVEDLAINLIEFNPKVKEAFSYIFGSTLIVNNIETARRLGIGSARMVTLDGDLADTSGAMIGGFRGKTTYGSFKEKDLDSNLEKLEDEISKTRSLIEHIEKKRTQNDNEISISRELKADLEFEIIKLEKTLGIKTDVKDIEAKNKSLKQELGNIDKQLKDIINLIENKNKEISKLKATKNGLREKLNNPALAKTLEDLETKKNSTNEKLIGLNAEIKNINMQIETMLSPEIEKTGKIISQQDKEYETFKNELSNLTVLIKEKSLELKQKEKQEQESYGRLKNLAITRNKLNEKMQQKETEIIKHEERIRGIDQRVNNIAIDRAKFIAEFEGLNREFEQYKEGTIKRGLNIEELKDKIKEFEKTLASIGNVNLRALEIYENIEKEYNSLIEKAAKLKIEKEDVLKIIAEIDSKKEFAFMKCYNNINKRFKEIFTELSTKGGAYLELENKDSPLEGGVEIKVRFAGNKHLDIRSLSGGEKTLTALSLIFSIQEYQPSSFYLLDEVDAALDKRNSELLSKLVQKYSKNAQYIVISHNDVIITEANQVYGVSMQEGISKIISLKV